MIDFDEIETVTINNFNNGIGSVEAKMFFDGNVRILKGLIKKGSSNGLHLHESSLEVIYILQGEARCLLDDKVEIIKKGQIHYCPIGHKHAIYNDKDEDLIMLCVVPYFNK